MKQFATFALLSAAAVSGAVAIASGLDLDENARAAALLGIGFSGAAGGLALMLKRRTLMRKGLAGVMSAFVAMFALRGLMLGAGLFMVLRGSGNPFAFIAGFFGVYLVQQALELAWVVAEAKKQQPQKGVPAT